MANHPVTAIEVGEELLEALKRFAQTSELWTMIPIWEPLPGDIPLIDQSRRHDH